jgi:hypothetical protein
MDTMPFLEHLALSPPPQRTRLGFHGSEAMAIPFINFTDEISEQSSNVRLYVHILSSLFSCFQMTSGGLL